MIYGRNVTLVSDSEPLVHLLKQNKASGRTARWQAIISEFNVTNIRHLAGLKNVVPDFLSRMTAKNIESSIIDDLPLYENRKMPNNESSKSPGVHIMAASNATDSKQNTAIL